MIFRVLAIVARVALISDFGLMALSFLEDIRQIKIADLFNRATDILS
jgi:hypothetical protein